MSEPGNPSLFFTCKAHPEHPPTAFTDITLRDLFAAFALMGIIGSEDLSDGEGYWTGQIATRAYSTADAMLAERSKATPTPVVGPESSGSREGRGRDG